jgi:hypothetical protein
MKNHVCNKTNQQLQCINIKVEFCNYFIQPYIFIKKTWANPSSILKSLMFNHMCCTTSSSTYLFVFLTFFHIALHASSKIVLARTYNYSRPFIFMVYLEQSSSMGMVKSISFLASFFNTNSNKDILLLCVLWN